MTRKEPPQPPSVYRSVRVSQLVVAALTFVGLSGVAYLAKVVHSQQHVEDRAAAAEFRRSVVAIERALVHEVLEGAISRRTQYRLLLQQNPDNLVIAEELDKIENRIKQLSAQELQLTP